MVRNTNNIIPRVRPPFFWLLGQGWKLALSFLVPSWLLGQPDVTCRPIGLIGLRVGGGEQRVVIKVIKLICTERAFRLKPTSTLNCLIISHSAFSTVSDQTNARVIFFAFLKAFFESDSSEYEESGNRNWKGW